MSGGPAFSWSASARLQHSENRRRRDGKVRGLDPRDRWQEGDRLARRAGAGQAALPDAAVESTTMSHDGKVFAVALLAALAWAVAPVAEALSCVGAL